MPQTSSSSNDVAARSRPDWHAFGMLAAWAAGSSVVLLIYARAVAHSLDGPRLAILASWLLWLVYLAILARAAILRTKISSWLDPAPNHFVLPLMLWSTGNDVQMMRFPAIEAMIISIVSIYVGSRPMGVAVAQHALYLSEASLEHWVRSPPTGLAAAVMQLLVSATNLALGTSACCLLCLAHNRRTTLSSTPSASGESVSAGKPAEGHAHQQPARTQGKATSSFSQAGLSRRPSSVRSSLSCETSHSSPSCKPSAPSELSSAPTSPPSIHSHPSFCPNFTCRHSHIPSALAVQPQPKRCISRIPSATAIHSQTQPCISPRLSANPASYGWTPLLKSLCCKASILAWVQRAELRLLAAVPQEEAQLLASLLSAVFVGTRFLAYVANFTVPGSVAQSPLMDILGLLCGMMVGGSKISDLLRTQHMSYRCVRGLLHNIMPAHVADALEVYEAERELASTGKRSRALLSKPSVKSVRTSISGKGVLPKPSSRLNRSGEDHTKGAHSWSGNARSQPSEPSSALALSADPLSGNDPTSECNVPSGCEDKLGLDRMLSLCERHEEVTLIFADIANFTGLSDQVHPSEVMAFLGGLYKEYDQRAVEMGLYTIDIIGDCYMCAANLIKPLPYHVSAAVGFAQSILQVAKATLTPLGTPVRIRIGIHTGPAMSGVIGVHHLKFTVVGDTVNVASRMESTATHNTLQISKHAYEQLQREQLAMQSEATGQQGLAAGGFVDQDMQSQASKDDGHALVKGNSAPPCLLDSLPQERREDSAEFLGFWGSRSGNQSSPDLAAQTQQHPWQQWLGTAAQAPVAPLALMPRRSSTELDAQQCPDTAAQAPVPPVEKEPRHSSIEQATQAQQQLWQQQGRSHHEEEQNEPLQEQQQQQQQQQQCCDLEPGVQTTRVQNKQQQPQSFCVQSYSLSQGGAASCAATPAEQSNRLCAEQPLSTRPCAEQPQSSCPCAEQNRHTCMPEGLEHVLAAAMPAEQSSHLLVEQSGHTSKLGGPEHVPARPSCQSQAWRSGRSLSCPTLDTRHLAQVDGRHSCDGRHRTTCHGSGDQGPRCRLDHGLAFLSSLDQDLVYPDGQDDGPVNFLKCSLKSNWLERELNIKGKGVMKAYTYTGQAQSGPCHYPCQ